MGDEAYRFLHELIRGVAYAGMPKESRGRLHELFAQWIESTAGDRVVEVEEVLGHHLEQAYRLRAETGFEDPSLARSAAERLDAVGRRAHARGDFQSAAGLLGRADELHDAAGLRQLELLHAAAPRCASRDRLPLLGAVIDEGLALATAEGNQRLESRLLRRAVLRATDWPIPR